MYIIWNSEIAGLDMKATGKRISRLINESGMNDKQLSRIMHLSVQSINKWRHGINLPDIENIYILSRVIGKRIEDFLVPTVNEQPMTEIETETVQDPEAALRRLGKYAALLINDIKSFSDTQIQEMLKSGWTFKHKTLEERTSDYNGILSLDGEFDWGEPVGSEVW